MIVTTPFRLKRLPLKSTASAIRTHIQNSFFTRQFIITIILTIPILEQIPNENGSLAVKLTCLIFAASNFYNKWQIHQTSAGE